VRGLGGGGEEPVRKTTAGMGGAKIKSLRSQPRRTREMDRTRIVPAQGLTRRRRRKKIESKANWERGGGMVGKKANGGAEEKKKRGVKRGVQIRYKIGFHEGGKGDEVGKRPSESKQTK